MFGDVRDLDGVLVTHQHADHRDPARIGSLLTANPMRRWDDLVLYFHPPGVSTGLLVGR